MEILFLIWILISAVCDAIYRKCYNWIVIFGISMAFIAVLLMPKSLPIKINFQDSLIGMFVGSFVFLFFYALKMMGAGDVKFAAALGAWVGWKFLLPVWALSCGFAVLHGLVVRSNLKYLFSETMNWEDGRQEKGKRFIPYVTYLSIATVIVLMLNK